MIIVFLGSLLMGIMAGSALDRIHNQLHRNSGNGVIYQKAGV